MKHKWTYFLFLFILSVVISCSDDDEILPPENPGSQNPNWNYNPTETDLNIPDYFPTIEKKTVVEEKFQLGRHLFYDKRLSRNETVSCASCHQQSMAFTDNRRFSIGLNGEQTPRHAMTVVNMLWEDIFFWDGRAPTLEAQALMPIQDHIEMDLTLPEAVQRLQALDLYDSLFFHAYGDTLVTPQKIGEAIAEFERGIISKDSKFDKVKRQEEEFTPQERLGEQLFLTHPGYYFDPNLQLNVFKRGGNCGDCHTSTLANKLIGPQGMKNNGLEFEADRQDDGFYKVTGDADDKGKFKTPSLRNVELTAPYMHDGRFNTLEEVLDHYNEHVKVSPTLDGLMYVNNDENQQGIISPDGNFIQLGLTQEEKDAIVVFLKTFTDYELISNPRYSNPFN